MNATAHTIAAGQLYRSIDRRRFLRVVGPHDTVGGLWVVQVGVKCRRPRKPLDAYWRVTKSVGPACWVADWIRKNLAEREPTAAAP